MKRFVSLLNYIRCKFSSNRYQSIIRYKHLLFSRFFQEFFKISFQLVYLHRLSLKKDRKSYVETRMNFSDLIEKLDSYPFYSVKYQVWRPNYYKFPQVSLFQRFDFKTFTRLHIYLNETPSLKPHNSIYWACWSQSQQRAASSIETESFSHFVNKSFYLNCLNLSSQKKI